MLYSVELTTNKKGSTFVEPFLSVTPSRFKPETFPIIDRDADQVEFLGDSH